MKSKQELIEKWESAIEAAEFYGKGKEERLISYMKDFVSDLNQLDEPGILSQEWIGSNSVYASSDGVTEEYVHVDDLKKLLVPKQELPVIPKFVADWIEETKPYNSLREAFEYIAQRKKDNHDDEQLAFWVGEGNSETFARAWIDGCTVEEEQKYVVPIDENHALCKFTNVVWGIYKESTDKLYLEDYFKFTKQEIKDYDDRYWPFAVKVEELEE